LREHLLFRLRQTSDASYNVLQKFAYLGVIVILGPLIVITGLTMSPAIDAVVPWLPGIFGGRQSARTLHFIATWLVVTFVAIHVVMVVATGFWNNLRSMITGWYGVARGAP
jgi:thiosulfate reductase cytochrome b subunit